MVEIKEYLEDEVPVVSVFDEEKMAEPLVIKRSHPTSSFYIVTTGKGKVPKALDTSFTGLGIAERTVVSYVKTMKPTQTAKRNANTKRREEQKNGAKS